MSEQIPSRNWRQFTLRQLMLAATLTAISCAITTQLVVAAQTHSVTRLQGWLLVLAAVVSGCSAIGILIRRPKTSVLIGVAAVLALWMIAIDVFWD